MFFLDFLNDIKKQHEDLRQVVRANYKIFEKNSDIHYERIKKSIVDTTTIDDVELLPNKSLSSIVSCLNDDKNKKTSTGYCHIFATLCALERQEADIQDILLEKVVVIIKGLQEDRDVTDTMKEILDDDITSHLDNLKECMQFKNSSNEAFQDNIMGMLENSKIGNLAKEISSSLDLNGLNIERPEELLDFRNLTNSNNVLGSIISKVGGTIKNKIDSGELSQNDLISEAMSFVGMINGGGGGGGKGSGGGASSPFDIMSMLNNPMISELVKGMSGGLAGNNQQNVRVDKTRVGQMATKERLQKELERRKQNKK
jgi:hypothetical protein